MFIKNKLNSPVMVHASTGSITLGPGESADVEGFQQGYADLYRASPFFEIGEGDKDKSAAPAEHQPAADAAAEPAEPADARAQYEALAGKPADKRWSDKRVAEEIAKLKA